MSWIDLLLSVGVRVEVAKVTSASAGRDSA